jgi:acetylornithine deacetylase
MTQDAAELLLDLIAIPSVSSMSNQPVIDYVIRFLDASIWDICLHPYVDAAGTTKNNLVAATKNAHGTHVELAFVCHTDTVPFDAGWPEAVHPTIVDGSLYGRGSCDVKGFLACVLAAFSQTDFGALNKPLCLVLTADEEVGCRGAKHLAQLKAFSARYMVIGEPTGLRPVCAGKGYSLGTITVRGREAHSAYPAAGRSAIYDAARVLLGLENLAAQLERDAVDTTFDPPFTTLNAGLIEGGTAKNIVPGECRITVEWRPIPCERPGHVPDRINRMLADLAASTPGFDARLSVARTDPPFAPSKSTRILELLSAISGNKPATIAFGSEAAHLAEMTSEAVVFGAGDMTVAHKTGEYVSVGDLRLCAQYLKTSVEQICG